ncbi:MAG: winged helix-turn-helix transcriptional regulator [Gemmatimonadota bacterium]|nr:winged helix-turn-helix transcriptional regulator [Gemmatimonadota bacterium]
MTPEAQNIEWKSSWRDEYLAWICGFANAQGGVLEIGRNDRGEVVGVKGVLGLLEEIPSKVRSLLGIVVDVNLKSEDGLEYIQIVVEPHSNPISYRGRFHYRSGSTKQVLEGAALTRLLLDKHGRTWDDVPLPGVALGDLESRAFTEFRRRGVESDRLPRSILQESDAAVIDRLQMREGAYLKRAAVLLFHPAPHRLVSEAYVKIGYFRGTEILYQDIVQGDLFSQIDRAMELLYSKYTRALISYDGIYRVETVPVPRDAMREAVTNAVMHRDYASPTSTQIRVYDDQISIGNAAQLPSDWTAPSDRAMQSRPHNPQVAHAFFRAGMIEAWGRGIPRITELCRDAGNPPPTWEMQPGGILRMRFSFSDAYQAADSVARTPRTGRKDAGSSGSFRTPPGNIQKTSRKHPEKTDTSHSLADRIIAFLRENPSASRRKLVEGLQDATEGSVKYQMSKLKRLGKLRRIGPDRGGRWMVVDGSETVDDGENEACADEAGGAPPEDDRKRTRNGNEHPENYQKTTRKPPDQMVQEPEDNQNWGATASRQPEPLPLPDRILAVLRQNPSASRRELAAALATTPSTVRYQLDKLRRAGRIERVGPDKGGRWKVLDVPHTEAGPSR